MKDLSTWVSSGLTKKDFADAFQRVTNMVKLAIEQMDARVTKRLAELQHGYTPVKGKDYFDGKPGYTPIKGKDYVDGKTPVAGVDFEVPLAPDPEPIAERAVELALPEIEKRLPALATAIRDALELLPEGEGPGVSVIKGLDQFVKDMVEKHAYSMGGGAVVSIMSNGAQKVQQVSNMNFKGAGAPTITIGANGVTELDFAAGGGGITTLAATETPNSSITVFTFSTAAAQPSYIVSDNVWLRATTKSGTVNWTWNSGTKKATLTIAPQDEIYAIV
jgi:hypothetical protein